MLVKIHHAYITIVTAVNKAVAVYSQEFLKPAFSKSHCNADVLFITEVAVTEPTSNATAVIIAVIFDLTAFIALLL